jgi:hypothetical protein
MNYSYIITSGWWCDNDSSNDRDVKYGSSNLRQAVFFNTWYELIRENCNPKKIVVIDSNSPVKPDLKSYENVHFMELDYNPGHPTKHTGKYSGVTYAHLLGLTYTLLEDVDYWVYIEQDAIIKGKHLIEYAISKMKRDFMFGSGWGTPQPVQHSLMIIKKSAIPSFIKNLSKIEFKDSELSPEMKFAIAASPVLRLLPLFIIKVLTQKTFISRMVWKVFFIISNSYLGGFQPLPFGYGRSRPINHEDTFYYFQHGTEDEITKSLE